MRLDETMRGWHGWGACVAAAMAIAGCDGTVGTPGEADDTVAVKLEGEAVTSSLDEAGVSPVFEAAEPFLRLAILWDGTEATRFDVAVSSDGEEWSEWTAPEVGFSEGGAWFGTVPASGTELYYRYRVSPGDDAPTFLAIDPVAKLGVDTGEPPTEADLLDDGDGMDEAEGDVGAVTEALHSGTRIRLRVHGRRAWGARPPRCVSRTRPDRVTFHHTVTPTNDSMSPQRRLRQIQAYHMDGRGYCDIAYNYLISRDGRVWRGRGALRMGGHTYNNNSGNVGISFMGNYQSVSLNRAQRRNAAKLIARMHRRFPAVHLTRRDIKGHRQYSSTACPGNRAYAQLDRIVRIARGF